MYREGWPCLAPWRKHLTAYQCYRYQFIYLFKAFIYYPTFLQNVALKAVNKYMKWHINMPIHLEAVLNCNTADDVALALVPPGALYWLSVWFYPRLHSFLLLQCLLHLTASSEWCGQKRWWSGLSTWECSSQYLTAALGHPSPDQCSQKQPS